MKVFIFSRDIRRGFISTLLLLGVFSLSNTAIAQSALEMALKAPTEPYHRLDYHLGSWIALLITVSSVLIAGALNHASSNVRTMGTLLAALGCFSVVGWFVFFALNSGVLENQRSVTFLTDTIKPTILWVQAATSFLVGVFLLRVAVWQSRRTETLNLPADNTPDRFGRVSRYLHWITAIMFISLFPIGIFTSMLPFDAPYRQGYYVVHKTIGFTVLGLLIVRLFWNRRTPAPEMDAQLTGWERTSAKIVHVLLYVLMIALPVSGFIMATSMGKWSHFYMWDIPLLWDRDLQMAKIFNVLHKIILPYICYIVIGAHILGALKHHFVDKHHKSIHRMVS